MVSVSTNGGALTARYHARLTGANSSKAVQMLASGARINGAGDDAAGLAVASKMKSQLRGLHAAMLNTSQGISLLQTAAEGMQTAEKLVQRIRELAVQSHNGTYTDNDRMNLQFEADSLLNQLTQNVEGTKFNDINLIDGSYERFMRVGNANSDVVRVAIDGVGIKTSIKGDSLASGTSTKVLVPSSQSSGTSSVNFPQTSFAASGTSELIYKATSTASGISVDGRDNTPAALASTEVSVAASSHASGTTSVVVPATAATTGTSIPDRQNPTDAVISEASQFVAQGFQNGDFSATNFTQQTTPDGHIISIEGWDIHLQRIEMDGDPFQIGGYQVPLDTTRDPRAVEDSFLGVLPAFDPYVLESKLQNSARGAHWDIQNGELTLSHDGNIYGHGFSITRGPYVISDYSMPLKVGDVVSFEWFGEAGGDAFDTYGYLLNVDDGSTVELLNATGVKPSSGPGKSTLQLLNEGHPWTDDFQIGSDGWVLSSETVSQAGNYRFVYIAGSFDATGGKLHGNGLSIRDVDVIPANNETIGIASVEVRESDDVRIDSGLLASMQNIVSSDPGGSFSLLTDTADHTKFTADPVTGNIRANQPLLINSQEVYTLNLRYDGPNGFQHTETITITLTPSTDSYATLNAAGASQISLEANDLTGMQDFITYATRHSLMPLSYGIEAYSDNDGNSDNNGNPNEHLNFQIDPATGRVTSTGPLSFVDGPDFHFNIRATATDGSIFTEHVRLSLSDANSATGQFSAEEGDEITLPLADLTALNDYMSRHPGGSLSIASAGQDNMLFEILGEQIMAPNGLRASPQGTFNFAVHYTHSPDVFIQNVTLNITPARKADSIINIEEGQPFRFDIVDFSHIHPFALTDGYTGNFRLEPYNNEDGDPTNDGQANEVNKFAIDSTGTRIISHLPLRFDDTPTLHFNLVYTASDGREIVERVVVNVEEQTGVYANLAAEESNQIIVNIADLTASADFALAHPGGSYSIGAGGDLFHLQGNQIVATKKFRIEDQASYQFELNYSNGSHFLTENVTLNLYEARTSYVRTNAVEGDEIIIPNSEYPNLERFVRANPNGVFSLTGPDAGKFRLTDTNSLRSVQPLRHSVQDSYQLNLVYTANGKIFSTSLNLDILPANTANSQFRVEESDQITIAGSAMTSLQAFAAHQNFAGHFELIEEGDYHFFDIAADGTVTAKQSLFLEDNPVLNLKVRFDADNQRDFIETITLNLDPTSLNESRSHFSALESGRVFIVPEAQSYLKAYAAADQYNGYFEILSSPYSTADDHLNFSVNAQGDIASIGEIDFENGPPQFEVKIRYHHSGGLEQFTDFLRLEVINDKTDDNNLALEGLDISTQKNALAAILKLDRALQHLALAQANLGALQNRFNFNIETISQLTMQFEAAHGRIMDADFARTSGLLAKYSILNQASSSMLGTANENQRLILELLEVL